MSVAAVQPMSARYSDELIRFLTDHPLLIVLVTSLVVFVFLALVFLIIFVVRRPCKTIEKVFGDLKDTVTHSLNEVCNILKSEELPFLTDYIERKKKKKKKRKKKKKHKKK